MDILAEAIARLSGYFGNAIVVPESNRGEFLIENLARHLRELHQPNGGFRCPFPWINSEFRTFIRHKDGTEGALKITGCHDDQVIATALALLCKNAATPYHPATHHPSLIPADLRDNEVRREVW